jgi:hypothetical protein
LLPLLLLPEMNDTTCPGMMASRDALIRTEVRVCAPRAGGEKKRGEKGAPASPSRRELPSGYPALPPVPLLKINGSPLKRIQV